MKNILAPNAKHFHLYFGRWGERTMRRYLKLSDDYNISVGKLIIAAMECCLGSFEKNIPKKRVVKINVSDEETTWKNEVRI